MSESFIDTLVFPPASTNEAMEKMKLQEMEDKRRKKAAEEKLKREEEEEQQRIIRKEAEEKARIEMEKLRIRKRLEEKLQNEEKVKGELRTLIKAEAASKEFLNVLIKQGEFFIHYFCYY